jgi:pyruvate dehydrogenase E2 component (dihydrolipoamide acetyltransferase)
MATPVIMPRQGQSVESCIIGKWHKQVGDPVAVGDILFTYETDKATFDEASKVDGELLIQYFEEGDDVPCLLNVCVIGKKGEDIALFTPNGATASAAEVKPATAATAAAPAAPDVKASSTDLAAQAAPVGAGIADLSDLAISPRARGIAEKNNVDMRAVLPTGPKDRVIERDIRKLIDEGKFATGAAGADYAAGTVGTGIGGRVSVADTAKVPAAVKAPAGPVSYEEKHTTIRKIIAKSMAASLGTMAQLTLNTSFDATDIIEFRAKMKKAKESGLADLLGLTLAQATPTFNDVILYAVSRVVKNHRLCNAHYYDDRMVFFNTVNLGMAVDTPRGLMVPTIFGADLLSITEISTEAKALAAACQKGTISPDLIKDGTITITNLGTLGVESFTPVINPPQTCILGVDCLTTRVKDVGGTAVPYQAMGLSLTFDHRAIDGAPAARFLKDLKDALESFSLLLMQ